MYVVEANITSNYFQYHFIVQTYDMYACYGPSYYCLLDVNYYLNYSVVCVNNDVCSFADDDCISFINKQCIPVLYAIYTTSSIAMIGTLLLRAAIISKLTIFISNVACVCAASTYSLTIIMLTCCLFKLMYKCTNAQMYKCTNNNITYYIEKTILRLQIKFEGGGIINIQASKYKYNIVHNIHDTTHIIYIIYKYQQKY
jgi:hypothetical protein